ncbi:MAG: SufE family protein [Bacteroidales bacterium]|nr:SufE family protein [Bacteroidales bacterium]MDD2322945.1 SufE family protein [Bacteroidales bacterium]MDD3011247.1 SufE family protein [Bacteroidales bacterium]MDD3961918.1 SufE family protein [Bacteroidales bacterium]MDY0285317.1 SufE family protein [Bacteroidales bacterium]
MIKEKTDQLVSEFSLFDEWMDKYTYLIELGKTVPPIDEDKKKEENLIKGCQSRVWLDATLAEGKIHFTADSDAIITKGIAALLIRVFNHETPEAILEADLSFLDTLGLKEHLSPTRSNGLLSMVKQIKFYAMAFQAKS